MIKNKKGFEFSFAWLFAILVGAVIIFIAIFATTSILKTSRTESDIKVAAQLGTLLNPIETNLEESKYAVITFPTETRVFNNCRESGNFGRQIISASVRSGLGEEFQDPEVETFFFNKYMFSKDVEQGKKLYILVKPFKLPYKVADLIFASAGNYCFINPPNDIEDDITSLNPENIRIGFDAADCSSDSDIVCFSGSGEECDINVNLATQNVEKDGKILHYEGELIYGAIFADPALYECQVRRLMKRTGELAHLYVAKTEFLSGKGCSSGLDANLRNFAVISQIDSSSDLPVVVQEAENIRRKNELLDCKLF